MMTKHYIASGKNWKWKGTPQMIPQWCRSNGSRAFWKIHFRPSWQTWKSQPTNSSWHFISFWNLWWKYESFSSELWDLSSTHPIQRFSFPVDSDNPPACVATLPGVVGSSSIEGNKAASDMQGERWNWEMLGNLHPQKFKELIAKMAIFLFKEPPFSRRIDQDALMGFALIKCSLQRESAQKFDIKNSHFTQNMTSIPSEWSHVPPYGKSDLSSQAPRKGIC